MSENLFSRIEPHLMAVAKPSRYLNHEFGALYKADASYRLALVYPDVYEIGQSNQAIAILYDRVNACPNVAAERVYLPWTDLAQIMRREDIPLFSMESYAPVRSFDMVGITLPHELAYTNCLEVLSLAQIPLLAAERGEDCPLVIGGGPCSYNPEPLYAFFDAFCIGEGEQQVPELCHLHAQLKAEGKSRAQILEAFAARGDIYVPSLYEEREGACVSVGTTAPALVRKALDVEFSQEGAGGHVMVPYAEVTHDRYAVEVLRGCARGCRFCQAGMMYRPVRERSADEVVSAVAKGLACTGFDEVSLTSLSTTDHSQLPEILRRLNVMLEGTGTSVSIPSQRLDAFGVEMAHLVAGAKKAGLTFAPEAGTQRLRNIINKNVTEQNLIDALQAAIKAGWRGAKLYFMCGLPGETDEDLAGMGQLVARALEAAREAAPADARGSVRIRVSCALFVPKPHTPFQWCGQVEGEEIARRVEVIRQHMPKKGVDFKWHDSGTSLIEAALARGGRNMAAVVQRAWEAGARFDAWIEMFDAQAWQAGAAACGIDLQQQASQVFDVEDALPWDHISCGVSKRYLQQEYKKALAEQTTPDCTFAGCTGCGVCPDYDTNLALAGERQ